MDKEKLKELLNYLERAEGINLDFREPLINIVQAILAD